MTSPRPYLPLNKEMAAMIVFLTNPRGIEFYSYANFFFCLDSNIWKLISCVKTSNRRTLTLLSNEQTFKHATLTFQNVLGHSKFSYKLEYMPNEIQRPCRNRQRSIILSYSHASKNVKTNVALSFLHLVDTHFLAGHKLQ